MKGVVFKPHQREAIQKLRSGSILCGGVGTGKSITALGYFYEKECEGVQWTDGVSRGPMLNPKPLYIITTARKRDTHEWEKECDTFGGLDIPITVDSWNNLHKYEDVSDAFFIFDEQRVVGSGSWVKSFLKVTRANHWLLLSATPGDTWMDYIPVFLANGFYKNRTQFLRRHAVYNRFLKYPKVDRWVDTGYLESLRRKITVLMKYEKHTSRHYEDIYVDYDSVLYQKIAKDRWNVFENKPVEDIAGLCSLLRKASSSAISVTLEGQSVNAKAYEIFRLWDTLHPRIIVFYNYDYELGAMKQTFDKLVGTDGYSIIYAEWNGHKHEPLPKEKRWVYLVQYAAGAEGWNCVETNTIVFYSQSYSYKMMEQASGRIDRMNTPYEDLFYYTLRTSAPIENAVSKALKMKKNFNEKLWVEKCLTFMQQNSRQKQGL